MHKEFLQMIEQRSTNAPREQNPCNLICNEVLFEEKGGENDACSNNKRHNCHYLGSAADFYFAVSVPRVETDKGDRCMQAGEAIESGVARPYIVNLARPKVAYYGVGKEVLVPPIH